MRTAWAMACSSGAVVALVSVASAQFTQTTLVSNTPGGSFMNPNFVNPGGIAASPTGPLFVGNAGTGQLLSFNGIGATQPIAVGVPSATGVPNTGIPTAMVFSPGSGFVFNNGAGFNGPARFIIATRDGTIQAFNQGPDPNNPITNSFTVVNNASTNANFTGLALGSVSGQDRLFATDFRNGQVRVFDNSFQPITSPTAFVDPTLPAGLAPLNVSTIGNRVFVTFAQRDASGAIVPGASTGAISTFDLNGNFINRFATAGELNAPSAVALAPSNFGELSNTVLVGNFGNGRINAFNATTGAFVGTVTDNNGQAIANPGLRALTFGNGGEGGAANSLFFTSGGLNGLSGTFGNIAIPTPGALALLVLGGIAAFRRRRS
jgi:uncharacterized protein (TIGR03118 family)